MPGRDAAPSSTPGWTLFAASAFALGWLALPDVGFRDSGEIGTAGAVLGVAHPTGFAIDLLLLRAAALVPLGNVAWRQNTCVACEAAAALGVLAHLCDSLARRLGASYAPARWGGAWLAVAGCAAWLTFLQSAIAVEVYALALLAVLLAAAGLVHGGRARALCWLVLGFAPGLHVTAGLCVALLCAGAWLQAGATWRELRTRLPLVAFGLLIIAYLPLASVRNPVLDWGDPETPARILQHLTAARIRAAEHADARLADAPAASVVMRQWFELWPFLPAALVALIAGLRRAPLVVLGPLALLGVDLVYAVWINPMGAPDRQVGHVAGASLALLAGVGVACVGQQACARRALLRGAFVLACASAGAWLLWRAPRAELADGYVASELLGSGGPLAALPPHAILVCTNDDACAAGTFALAVDAVRPDVDVAPAQHLWDYTVLRRIEGVPGFATAAREPLPFAARPAAMRRALQTLALPAQPRPVLFELADPLHRMGLSVLVGASETAPLLRVLQADAPAPPIDAALAQLDRARSARLGSVTATPSSERGRYAWSQAYSSLGEQALASSSGVRALRSAVLLAPTRAAAWTNLSVALERNADLPQAVRCAERAIELAPQRPTPWVNLVRWQAALGHAAAARHVLELSRRAGVRDARLDRLASELPR